MEQSRLAARSRAGSRTARLGLYANILLTVGKLAAGYLANSRALIADALHSASDIATDICVMVGFHFAGKPPDSHHRWGHGKFETLYSQIVGVFLIAAGIGIGIDAIHTIIDARAGQIIPRPGLLALVAAFVSIVVKEFMYQITAKQARKLESASLMANAWHHRSDALSSIGAFLGIGGARFLGEQWRILDPLTAVIVSIIVIYTGWKITFDAIKELLETSLPHSTEDRIMEVILSVKGVSNPHKLRTRKVGHAYSIEVHIEVQPEMTVRVSHDIATHVQDALESEFGPDTFTIVHVEPCETCKYG
mgnify:CR=1 FL=1